MKRIIAVLFLIFASAMAFAGAASNIRQIDVTKLTTDQRAALLAAATKMEQEPAATPGFSEAMRNEVEKWGELGSGMGRAAVSAAKEVGIAANDFVGTPLGKVTMGVVLYKIMGRDILKFGVCMLLVTIFLPLGIFFVTKKHGNVEYDYVPVFKGVWNKRVVKKYIVMEGQIFADYALAIICGVIIVAAAINSF